MTFQVDQPPLEQTGSDVLDPVARRRLQNRLNQRASRKRKASECKRQRKPADGKWIVYVEDPNIPNKNAFTEETTSHEVTKPSPPPRHNEKSECMNRLHAKALHMMENPVLSPNPTFYIFQYNIFRAMLFNADLMGLTIDLLDEDLASQFNLVGPSTSATHLPASLCPSPKQKKIIHHPWIDLIPILSLREALLARADVLDEDELCSDLYGGCASQGVGLCVWGEAWDPRAYEVSETLIRKWSWMVNDCPDVIKTSNYWRKQRGEKPFVLKIK
ncbi:unnamed protein product [Penicillium nalgiovense]|uniref:BZIP domain-containing protein n=1 Tax=Penicillium nalgiovense TaxID=60175 RepID=A0A9W4H9G9_PENNA|nr:unnamed protein product [Penicillium nalgiovense]CAG7939392.1 unnamed protein product [Penicillium nalgiovense]CAG7941793.1 unnamed protein product [Penicillium nalgiovense]CAG7942555.1 unnamed protein product [Penicillium nalgiovense]CAG7949012.1 unnamed protein product [Penicillium nalgiovense]